jgi:hypothetical protein
MSAAPKRFVPSNPGGKPGRLRGAKMVEKIGELTEDGKHIAAFMVRVYKGLEKGANMSHRVRAAEWLADRYAGKAVEVALTGDLDSTANPLSDLSPTELKALIYKMAGKSVGQNPQISARDVSPAETMGDNAPQQADILKDESACAPTSVQPPENT